MLSGSHNPYRPDPCGCAVRPGQWSQNLILLAIGGELPRPRFTAQMLVSKVGFQAWSVAFGVPDLSQVLRLRPPAESTLDRMYRLSFSGLMAGTHCGAPPGQGRSGLQVDRIHPDRRGALEAVGLVLELQHPARADVGAHAAADAATQAARLTSMLAMAYWRTSMPISQ